MEFLIIIGLAMFFFHGITVETRLTEILEELRKRK